MKPLLFQSRRPSVVSSPAEWLVAFLRDGAVLGTQYWSLMLAGWTFSNDAIGPTLSLHLCYPCHFICAHLPVLGQLILETG